VTPTRSSAQTSGLIIAAVLGVYSLYLQLDLMDSNVYRAVSESRVSGWTLVQGIASVVGACTMTAAGILAGIALARSTRTRFAGTAALLLAGAAAWIVRDLSFIVQAGDEIGAGDALSAYFKSVEHADLPYKWPVVWATVAALAVAGALLLRDGRVTATAAPAQPSVATLPQQTPVAPAAPSSASFHVHVGGAPYGPYDLDEMRRFVREGRVQPGTLVWPGVGDWVPAAHVPGLVPQGAPSA
jgi:hypothetical protein